MNDLFAPIELTGPRVRNLAKSGMKPEMLPSNGVYIGNYVRFMRWPQTKWGNEFGKRYGTRVERIALFEQKLRCDAALMAQLPELRGKDLYCWCAPEACHGDVLLRLANG